MKSAITAIPAIAVLALGLLAACDRPATTGTSTTTVVKEPTVVQKEKETVVQPAPAPAPSTTVNVDATKPANEETTKSTTTSRVDTPMGSATKTETTRSTSK
jgi:hypothetical protein